MDKKNIPLYIALAVPVLMIGLVAVLVYLPRFGPLPKYNFIYSSGGTYPYGYYTVSGNTLQKNENRIKQDIKDNIVVTEPRLFLHDVATNQSREISLGEGQKLKLDSTDESPDGFKITMGNYDDGIFGIFGGSGRDYGSRYIANNGGGGVKLNLKSVSGAYYDSYSFQFLGWIIP